MTDIVNQTVAIATILAHFFLVIAVPYFFFEKKGGPFKNFLGRHGLLLAWLTSLVAVMLSLFYSDIAGFKPCQLCWWQRIFLYPQVVWLGLAWFKKDSKIVDYVRPLAISGAAVAAYHSYLQYGGTAILSCGAAGSGSACVTRYVFEFGYVTIPLMSLTAFLLLIFFLSIPKSHNKNDSIQP